jgi:hypothetical protein
MKSADGIISHFGGASAGPGAQLPAPGGPFSSGSVPPGVHTGERVVAGKVRGVHNPPRRVPATYFFTVSEVN